MNDSITRKYMIYTNIYIKTYIKIDTAEARAISFYKLKKLQIQSISPSLLPRNREKLLPYVIELVISKVSLLETDISFCGCMEKYTEKQLSAR